MPNRAAALVAAVIIAASAGAARAEQRDPGTRSVEQATSNVEARNASETDIDRFEAS